MPTPNLGLTIPVGGTTPGAANNTTPGTYPFQWSANLTIIDTNCLSIPNNPAGIANGGIKQPLDGNVNFGGFAVSNASTGAFSGSVSIGGVATLTGGVTSPLVVGAGLLNQITLAGKATGTDPTITIAGDATRNLQILVPSAAAATIAGLQISASSGSPSFIGSNGGVTSASLWLGQSAATATASNYTLLTVPNLTTLRDPEQINLNVGASNILAIIASAIDVQANVPIQQTTAATALTLKGNAALTGALGAVILDNIGAQTTGTILSVRTGGTEKLAIDWTGNVQMTAGNTIQVNTANASLNLNGNAPAAGTGAFISNTTDVGGTGTILAFRANAATQLSISGRGHIIPLSTAPTAVLNALYGSTATSPCTGGDASFRIAILSQGAGIGSIAAGTLIATVTLAQPYSSANFTALASFASNVAVGEISPLQCVAVGATIQIYNYAGFTPVTGHNYVIDIITMGAGATS